jgi:hypothetical protein
MSPTDRVAQLYLQAPGSLFVTFYDSQGCGADILKRLHTGFKKCTKIKYRKYSIKEVWGRLCNNQIGFSRSGCTRT